MDLEEEARGEAQAGGGFGRGVREGKGVFGGFCSIGLSWWVRLWSLKYMDGL